MCFWFRFFFIVKIKNNKLEKVKKFNNVKLYGAKPNIVITPSKNGAKNTTNNLLSIKVVKWNLKSFSQIYSFQNNLYF